MKSIKQNQLLDVNDTCNTCGAFVDVGAVIGEDDKQLVVSLSGDRAEQEAQDLIAAATSQFSDVSYHLDSINNELVLTFDFVVAVEKMLFQMQNKLV
ncbi:DUF406 family protein [Parashewanella curva]|uniref:DUF406 family protein n=1 Tax=Parashewanella curva TaxID=2338552 RepID=A0A3L8PYS2_9GAMM|nr:DUF406 family protein [Parashewanella curva]RLV60606.1 DUF406 family protein [Parashewanella curva]